MASEIETLEDKKHEDGLNKDVEVKGNEELKQEDEEDEGEESSKRGRRNRKVKTDKEAVTPVDRPTRERKTVERYTESMQRLSAPKPFSVEKGSGTQLKDIPNVAYKLSKRKADDTLQSLHIVMFSKRAKMNTLKKNVGLFSGFVWADDEMEKQKLKIKEKLDKFTKEKLFEFCDILNLQIYKSSLKKEEVSLKLLEFLQSPHATTEVLLAEKEQKAKNRKTKARQSRTPSTKQSGEKRKRTPKVKEEKNVDEDEDEDEKNTPSKPESDEEMVKFEEEGGDDEDDTDPESDNEKEKSEEGGDDEEEENMSESDDEKDKSEKQEKSSSKKIVKKDSKAVKKDDVESPAKSNKRSKRGGDTSTATLGSSAKSKASSKKPKEEKSSKKVEAKSSAKKDSAKDQGKGKTNKKAKTEPTNEEMHAVVVSILKEVDFNTATLSDIIKQLGTHFGQDLLHRKAEVKAIITDVINNMSGDEDEEEEKEADGGSDEDRDGDGDGENSDS